MAGGGLYILVAYELLRRSSNITVYKNSALRRPNVSRYMNSPHSIVNAPVIDIMSNYNETPLPILYPTLEENIVAERTPIGRSDSNTYIDTLFKPIYDKNTGSAYV